LREDIEKQQMLETAGAQRKVDDEINKLHLLEDRNKTCWKKIHEHRSNGCFNAQELELYYRYSKKLESEIEKQKEKLADARNEFDKCRKELISASKDRKVLEKLKERKFTHHKSLVDKKEQNLIDELSVLNHSR
jgi:flagellar FliJ protein